MKVPQSKFCYFLQEINGLQDDFSHWHFQPGMLFGECDAWWQTGLTRSDPHEGIDFCSYVNRAGAIVSLNGRTKVPALFDGEIVRVFDDFMGRSILIGHDFFEGEKRFYSLYAHVRPRKNQIGVRVEAGQRIATIAPAKGKKVPAHLHLTTLLIQETVPEELSWETIIRLPEVTLCSPVKYIDPGIWYVYIVRCADGSLYSGITTDLSRRLAEHNAAKGGARYTRARQPVTLYYYEIAASRSAAAKREAVLKKMSHARKRELPRTNDR